MKEGAPVPAEQDKSAFELAIESAVGDSVESIRKMPIDERRALVEAAHGAPMAVISHWPFIGRREPLPTLSRTEVDALVDEAIR